MKRSILFLALLSSTFIAKPCAWGPEGDYIRFCLFSQDLAGGTDMSDLFYSAHQFNWYKVDEYSGPNENLNEWYNYFEGKFTIADIDMVIYDKPNQDKYKNSPLIKHFEDGRSAEAAEYIRFSKLLEEQLRIDYWEEKEMDLEGMKQSLDLAVNRYNSVVDETIKLRYAFQVVVISYYLNNEKVVEEWYKKVILPYPKESVIKVWAEFYYGNMKDYDDRFYILSKVFDDSKSKNRYIFQKFPENRDQLKGVLQKCQNNKERAAVLSILAYKNPARANDQILEIAQLNAGDELLDILFVREINKLEDWYLSRKHLGMGPGINTWNDDVFGFIADKNFESDKTYLKKFKGTAQKIVDSYTVDNPALWHAGIAYMEYMLDNEKGTEKSLKKASKLAKTPEMKGQIAVISMLSRVKNQADWSEGFQQEIADGLKEIESYKDHLYDFQRFYAQIVLAISNKYMDEGDLTLAALFRAKVMGHNLNFTYQYWGEEESPYQAFRLLDANANSEDMTAFFDFWNKPNKTEMETWLMKGMEPWRWRFMDLWGTSFLREDNLQAAYEIYQKIPSEVWYSDDATYHYYYKQELRNDPFETNMIGRGYGGNKTGSTYTKPEFVNEIMALKQQLESGEGNKSYIALLLGNAYYNMTYNGNSYYYTEYSWGYVWGGYHESEGTRNQDYYYNSERALKYYKLAEDYAPNDDYAAFCHRMQLKCLRDKAYHDADGYEEYKKVKNYQGDLWENFVKKYPDHAEKLQNCDHYLHYSQAWKG
ncbi:hypothetical protein K6119_18890 [Paracrocinitomix mangrovi]|uniref:hypothetical protein n=1 Tax=Paracrocinitomix mangrovi TaxID=2862509 RepID=UPI001C8E79D6|nr:hypothetical protein [Paracrocinitomix mangrovi]UKN01794.1 hypothetical protein K6119_18890 [Paracrocinitomix mangrovi]